MMVRHGALDTLRDGVHRSGCHPLGGADLEATGAAVTPCRENRRAPYYGASLEGDSRRLGPFAREALRDDTGRRLVEGAAAAPAGGRGSTPPEAKHRTRTGRAPALVGRGGAVERRQPVPQA